MVEVSAVGSPADGTFQREVGDIADLLYPLVIPPATGPVVMQGGAPSSAAVSQ